ncbi:hypothetical protein Tco_1296646 [Tanacetum coccineum]
MGTQSLLPGCSWRGHLRGVHIHYCPGVLGGDTCEGYIFITARVLLEGTPVMGTYGLHYCPGVLGGDTYDGNAPRHISAVTHFWGCYNLPTDPLIPDLEDTGIFSGAYDDEDVGAEADLNNLETTMNSLRRKTSHSQLVDQKFNSFSTNSFSEDVCQLILRIDKVKFDHLILNMLLDKVKSDVYMLGSGMLNVVAA